MSNLALLPEDIRSELSIDEQGRAFASRRAIARLADINLSAIQGLLAKIADQQKCPEIFESFAGQEFDSTSQIPDLLVSLIIEYYAYECQERYRTEQAKRVCRAFRAIGFRSWLQSELGWQKQPRQPQRQLPPIRDAIDYIQAAQILENLKNPMLRSLLEQRLAEDVTPTNRLLTGAAQPETTYVIASVRAAQLGYTERQIEGGARLGKFVLRQGLKPVGKIQHGKYPVNVYELTEDLDKAIHAYFS